MRPMPWSPPIEWSGVEAALKRRLRQKSRFYLLLREIRHELLSSEFQAELATLYKDAPKGQPPIPPGQLALATLLQAYTGLSDEDVIDATVADRRWQLVLDCWDAETPPFAQGTLVHFRQRLIAADLDRRLIERTVELAEARGGFSRARLKLALDSSPLWGAGRVEDTVNLLGTALRRAVAALARQAGRAAADEAAALGTPALAGPSLKGALDLDWTDPTARDQALAQVLAALEVLEQRVAEADDLPPPVTSHMAAAHQVESQDVTVGPTGQPTLRRGVAAERRISIADGEQRHGRKSRRERVDGYKRHVVRDLAQAGLIRAVAVTGANRPDAAATPAIAADLAAQRVSVGEWHVDRAYFASPLVSERDPATQIWCKPHRVTNRAQFPKTAFTFDPDQQRLTCPAGVTRPARPGRTVHFPAERCDGCVFRAQCTRSKPGVGRSVQVHAEEALLLQLRAAQATPAGRAKLRERIGVEHSLARIGQVQGTDARYFGERKQLFDTRRAACVVNLQILDRLPSPAASDTSRQIT